MGCFGNFQKLQKRKILTFSPILAWISISSMWNSGMKCSAVSWVKDSTQTVNLNLVTDFRIFLQQNEFGSLQSDMCGIWLTMFQGGRMRLSKKCDLSKLFAFTRVAKNYRSSSSLLFYAIAKRNLWVVLKLTSH